MFDQNRNEPGRFKRTSLHETIVIVVVGALAVGLFLGIVRVMTPGNSSREESSPQATESAPSAVDAPAAHGEAGDAPVGPQSPPPGST